jgi:hypothetical protein
MTILKHPTIDQLESGLDHIFQSPANRGRVEMINCRPGVDLREELDQCQLDCEVGLVGDGWLGRDRSDMPAAEYLQTQLTLMNSRAIGLIAGPRERWSLAGDQFYIDLNLSSDNLPAGTRLMLGTATIEITSEPHTGCHKFAQRYGKAALKFVNSERGRHWNLRGVNARVIENGAVRLGDLAVKSA